MAKIKQITMVNIRNATTDDAAIISNFQVKMALETEALSLNKETVNKGVKAVFENPNKGKYFIAEVDNKVVGSLLITTEWSDWRNQWVWWIQSVYIEPAFRGKKIFSQLYTFIKNLVETDDEVAGLRLYVDLTNEKARKIYQAAGMNGEHYQLFEWMKNLKKSPVYILFFGIILFFTSCANPKKSEQLLDKGVEYYYHAQYTKAVKFFKHSIDEDDQNFEAWFWMGNYYENFGQHNKAIEAYNKTIKLNPDFADAFANRAKVKKNTGDKKGACTDWRKADKLGKPNLTDNLNWCERNGF